MIAILWFSCDCFAFSVLMLFVGWQEEHPACKSWVVRFWHDYLSGLWSEVHMICIWFGWCHRHPIISCFIKIQNGLPFWCWLTQVVLEQRPLNGCTGSVLCREISTPPLTILCVLKTKCACVCVRCDVRLKTVFIQMIRTPDFNRQNWLFRYSFHVYESVSNSSINPWPCASSKEAVVDVVLLVVVNLLCDTAH